MHFKETQTRFIRVVCCSKHKLTEILQPELQFPEHLYLGIFCFNAQSNKNQILQLL